MASLEELHRLAEVNRLVDVLMLKRSDIIARRVTRRQLADSLKHFPPPRRVLTDCDVRSILEPKPIRWHKELISDYRDTTEPETIPYYRYSTDMQEHSIEHQSQIVKEWYDLRAASFQLPALTAKEFADPETSGTRPFFERRWGGQVACYVRPGDHLVFAYFDRIGRTAGDTLNLLQKLVEMQVYVHILDHAEFQYCDPTHPSTIKKIQEAAIESEHERRKISMRTRRAVQTHLAKGRAMGAGNYRAYRRVPNPNYDPNARVDSMNNPRYLVQFNPNEAAVAEIIYRLWAIDGWLVPEILSALRRKIVQCRDKRYLRSNGKPWTRDSVKYLIRKTHAERGRGGPAGMFLNAALNGNGGAN